VACSRAKFTLCPIFFSLNASSCHDEDWATGAEKNRVIVLFEFRSSERNTAEYCSSVCC
jgi:hypothetical protein